METTTQSVDASISLLVGRKQISTSVGRGEERKSITIGSGAD